jgi:FKBP-type peptidyl-prolyl cis-trans isomerase
LVHAIACRAKARQAKRDHYVRSEIMKSGIKLIEETVGEGPTAQTGDTVEFASQAFLSRGDPAQERYATSTRLGSRRIIAGVEYSLVGMQAGGYRKVKISPHLAYRDVGVPDKVPPDAVMIFELWMNRITKEDSEHNPGA